MATDARLIDIGVVPNVLVNRTRMRSPPVLRKITFRTVWSANPAPAGQVDPGTSDPTTGLAPQPAVHLPISGLAGPTDPDAAGAPSAAHTTAAMITIDRL
jgi:hypothetical protein